MISSKSIKYLLTLQLSVTCLGFSVFLMVDQATILSGYAPHFFAQLAVLTLVTVLYQPINQNRVAHYQLILMLTLPTVLLYQFLIQKWFDLNFITYVFVYYLLFHESKQNPKQRLLNNSFMYKAVFCFAAGILLLMLYEHFILKPSKERISYVFELHHSISAAMFATVYLACSNSISTKLGRIVGGIFILAASVQILNLLIVNRPINWAWPLLFIYLTLVSDLGAQYYERQREKT